MTVMALTETERWSAIRTRELERQGGDQPLFTSRFIQGDLLLLTMPSWSLFDSKWDWRGWLNSTFDVAIQKQAKGIILDLRGNEGGMDDIGRAILARLVSKTLELKAAERLVRYRIVPANLEPYLDTWDKSFLKLGADAPSFPGHLPHLPSVEWFELDERNTHAGNDIIEPVGNTYRGKVVVLTDAQNSSATFQFAEAVQANKLGRLVGEPTGGNKRGINGGAFFFLRLPGSGLEVDLPLIGYFPKEPVPDEGLMPDVNIPTKSSDVARDADPQLVAAMKLLR